MGAGVDDDETYPRQLEAWLHARGRSDVEVLNAAVLNYTVPQMAAAYERDLRAYDADAVLVPIYPGTLLGGRPRPEFRPPDPWDVNVRRALAHLYAHDAIRDAARAALSPWLALDWADRARPAERRPPPNYETLSVFARQREAEGKTLYLALLAKARRYGPTRFATARERLTGWAAGYPNVVVLDGLEGLDPVGLEKNQVYPGDSHPNGLHHARSAAAIGAKLLPRLPPARGPTP
jgi:hypothetical protein